MSTWGYEEANGPKTWCKSFPDAAGQKQSPIDIVTKNVECDATLLSTPLSITYSETDIEIVNCGFSFKVNVKNQSDIKGGPLEGTYRLEQFHLHWGSGDSEGSEHTIDGKNYAAELHLVHWNTKYSSFGEAVDKSDGLAVFGIMLDVGQEYVGFKHISDAIQKVKQKDQTFKVEGLFDLSGLLPSDTGSYWTYPGSLTTPPCCESVTWMVFAETLTMSSEQIEELRSLLDSKKGGKCIVNNYRSPLPLGDRKVRASFPATD